MYDISHKSSDHRHDPGVFRRLLFQCLSNCGIIRPREREAEGETGLGGGGGRRGDVARVAVVEVGGWGENL